MWYYKEVYFTDSKEEAIQLCTPQYPIDNDNNDIPIPTFSTDNITTLKSTCQKIEDLCKEYINKQRLNILNDLFDNNI